MPLTLEFPIIPLIKPKSFFGQKDFKSFHESKKAKKWVFKN